jgi:hypothetical protein
MISSHNPSIINQDFSEDEADALALWGVYAENVRFPRASVHRGLGPLFLATGVTGKISH